MDSLTKAYGSIEEIPTEVKNSLDEKDRKKWMDAYNQAIKDNDHETAKVIAWKSVMDAPSSFTVEFYGTVEVPDKDGELVDLASIKELSDAYISHGGLLHEDHSNVPIGTAWAWEERWNDEADAPGIVYYGNLYRGSVVFDRARERFMSGKQRWSLGGEAPRLGYECTDRGCYVRREATDLFEISLCQNDANGYAGTISYNGTAMAKSASLAKMTVTKYVLHRDDGTCPLQKAKKAIREIPIPLRCHIVKGRVLVKSHPKDVPVLVSEMMRKDMIFAYDTRTRTFSAMFRKDMAEQAEDDAYALGCAICKNDRTYILPGIPEAKFKDWYMDNLLERDPYGWFIKSEGKLSYDTHGVFFADYGGGEASPARVMRMQDIIEIAGGKRK